MAGICTSPCKCFQGCASAVVQRHRQEAVSSQWVRLQRRACPRDQFVPASTVLGNSFRQRKNRIFRSGIYSQNVENHWAEESEDLYIWLLLSVRHTATFKNINDATFCSNQTSRAPCPLVLDGSIKQSRLCRLPIHIFVKVFWETELGSIAGLCFTRIEFNPRGNQVVFKPRFVTAYSFSPTWKPRYKL